MNVLIEQCYQCPRKEMCKYLDINSDACYLPIDCLKCGKKFTTTNKIQKYCSRKCKDLQSEHRRRQKELSVWKNLMAKWNKENPDNQFTSITEFKKNLRDQYGTS